MNDRDFDLMLDEYQAGLAEAAAEAAERSYEAAARPNADPVEVTFADLRVGDYMTNEGPHGRWVRVVDLRGPLGYRKSRQQAVPDGMISVLFETPESVTVSGETRYWIDRPASGAVLIDQEARRNQDAANANAAYLAELEARQNELYLAMGVVEEMPASEAQTACIVKLGERMRRLVELRGKSEVGRSLDV